MAISGESVKQSYSLSTAFDTALQRHWGLSI